MSFAVGICVLDTSLGDWSEDQFLSVYVYCNNREAQLQYFNDATSQAVCDQNNWFQTVTATRTCDWIVNTQGVDIYGRV